MKRAARLPITVPVLAKFFAFSATRSRPERERDTPFLALATTAVHGLFRGGELAKKPKYELLQRKDITWHKEHFVIHLEASKTDSERLGVDVTVWRTGTPVCPFRVMKEYFESAPGKGLFDPLFQRARAPGTKAGRAKPITYRQLLGWVKEMAGGVGFDMKRIGTHSLRIGGATTLAALGVRKEYIQILGRWRSDCYQVYLRLSGEHFRSTAAKMANLFSESASGSLFGALSFEDALTVTIENIDAASPVCDREVGGSRS